MSELLYYCLCQSPCGELVLMSDGDALTGLYLPGHRGIPTPDGCRQQETRLLREAGRELRAYFAGELQTFDLPLHFTGTPFQQLVWRSLLEIPFGTTISYSELAQRIGRAGASRAVGAANGKNPISIVVPCHRVIGADGTLTGYGGGLDRKQWLLRHEAEVIRQARGEPLLAG